MRDCDSPEFPREMLPNIGMPGGDGFRLDVESARTSTSLTEIGNFPRGALAQSVAGLATLGATPTPSRAEPVTPALQVDGLAVSDNVVKVSVSHTQREFLAQPYMPWIVVETRVPSCVEADTCRLERKWQ